MPAIREVLINWRLSLSSCSASNFWRVTSWKIPRTATGLSFSMITLPLSRSQTTRPSAAIIRYSEV